MHKKQSDQAQVADEIYGTDMPEIESGRLVARPTPIDQIWADVKQPRRAVPASIRMHWNGDPEEVPELLGRWYLVASAERPIDVVGMLMGRGEGVDTEGASELFVEYVELIRLAQSIQREGLINPVRVVKQGARYMIESGERRWLAHWLLYSNTGGMSANTPSAADMDKWAKVPAIVSDGRDYVWRQAQENTARRQLNAIGMARQLALLVMDARTGLAGQADYDEWEAVVQSGVCDRRYYAQVADGNLHKIPRGLGERIQAAMGLSERQIHQYRRLLKLTEDEVVNDAVWVRADVENWTENALRVITTSTAVEVRARIEAGSAWTLEELRGLVTPPRSPLPASGEGERQEDDPADEVMSLGQTYEAFVREEIEAGGLSSDNADSGGSDRRVLGWRQELRAGRSMALQLGSHVVDSCCEWLAELTVEEARALALAGKLDEALAIRHDAVITMVEDWLGRIEELLNEIADVGNER